MLLQLYIRNYAIIEEVSLEFCKGLNIITGETGSGKTILLGALGLILGERADSKSLLDDKQKCIVEGTFTIVGLNLKDFFIAEDLDYSNKVIIRREINPAGKSRAFINDTPVNLKQLQKLTSQLVDLQGQFENMGIGDPDQQISMLDAMSHSKELYHHYHMLFHEYRSLLTQLDQCKAKQAEEERARDYIQFQLSELVDAEIDPGHDSALEEQLATLEHAEEIIQIMGHAVQMISENEQSLMEQLKTLRSQLDTLVSFHPAAEKLRDRIHSILIDLDDIAAEAEQIREDVEYNPERIQEVRDRMDTINHLLHKHQVADITSLEEVQDSFEKQIHQFDNRTQEISILEQKAQDTHAQLKKQALTLNERRRSVIPDLEEKVNALLQSLKMEHASFRVDIVDIDELTKYGLNKLRYLFAPNKGSRYYTINEVASGGEISRLSLVTKSLVADTLEMPSLIFDEIDSGVSGDVALKMGLLLKSLAENHQVISITHSPQVAAKAARHFHVFKDIRDGHTVARVKALKQEDRIIEIATMLSSSPPSEAAITSARELITQ